MIQKKYRTGKLHVNEEEKPTLTCLDSQQSGGMGSSCFKLDALQSFAYVDNSESYGKQYCTIHTIGRTTIDSRELDPTIYRLGQCHIHTLSGLSNFIHSRCWPSHSHSLREGVFETQMCHILGVVSEWQAYGNNRLL